jgi:hypothetical protein
MKVTEKYTFFWKDKISQWNMQSFKDQNNIEYNCAEQYMMAKKALLFQDQEAYQNIMNTNSPRTQQDEGRKIKNFNQKVWDANCQTIVYQGNYYKFTQNQNLLDILLSTEGTILVEASPIDKIWGIGLAEDNKDALDLDKWKGQNLLGFILTNLRDNCLLLKN